MTAAVAAKRRTDHVPVLHNCGPGTNAVYLTGNVGALSEILPRELVRRTLLLAGVQELSASMYRAPGSVHLHPALVAAASHATLELAARAVGESLPARDTELFARLAEGRRSLGTARAAYIDAAIELLIRVRGYVLQLCGGRSFTGVVRWSDEGLHSSARHSAPRSDFVLREEAARAVRHMTLVAHATPPIVSTRREPSLEYFRTTGVLQLRDFGPFVTESAT